ncbi:hypothetical protein B0H15DRAFT_69465 [Mycena belliarum]|uniref:Uncharacterized protein n=1 Tax=Mycena belliarum TaxID=1033014 RepID=A0AAD6XS84_9AGAR|nr:hypothetical protein B0H15DRAFT_69465 [Mycena belliae]
MLPNWRWPTTAMPLPQFLLSARTTRWSVPKRWRWRIPPMISTRWSRSRRRSPIPDMGLEAWSGFDKLQDAEEPLTPEEMIRQLEEMILPEDEAELWNICNDVVTEQDRDIIRAFKLKLMSNMPRAAFNQMRYAFQNKLDISSKWAIIHSSTRHTIPR